MRNFNALITNDNKLIMSGYNNAGHLGMPTNSKSYSHIPITNLDINETIDEVFTMGSSTLLKSGSSALGFGQNYYGELGIGTTAENFSGSVKYMTEGGFKKLVTGGNHVIALYSDGTVKVCGYNYYGQLGLGDKSNRNKLTNVDISDIPSKIIDISAYASQSFLLCEDGSVYSCGNNPYGELGLGYTSSSSYPITKFTKAKIENVKKIIPGGNSLFVILNDGTVKCCGANGSGQLGLGNYTNQTDFVDISLEGVVDIFSCYNNTYALLNDGTLKGCGNNSYGQLGTGDTSEKNSFVDIPLTNVKQISGKSNTNTYFLLEDGTLYGCGKNNIGQLGKKELNENLYKSPEKIELNFKVKSISSSYDFILLLSDENKAYGMGLNNYGQLTYPNTANAQFGTLIEEADFIKDVIKVERGNDGLFLLMNNGTIKARGANYYGQLGNNTTTNISDFTDISLLGDQVKDVVTGLDNYTLFLMNDGTVKGCGYNSYGQLGTGNTSNSTNVINIPISNVKKIACGYEHTIFLLNDGTVKGCGYNGYGQLGLGHTSNSSTITDIKNLPSNKKVIDVSCGTYSTYLLFDDGTMACCGSNSSGQLGLGNTSNSATLMFPEINNIKKIIATDSACYLILNNGKILACGDISYNTDYKLFLEKTELDSRVEDIISGRSHVLFIMKDGSVRSIGSNSYGQLALNAYISYANKPILTDFKNIKNTKRFSLINTNIIMGENQESLQFSFDIETVHNRFNENRIIQKIIKNNDFENVIETREISIPTQPVSKAFDFNEVGR